MRLSSVLPFVCLLAASSAFATPTVAVYNFDSLPTGPSTFAAAGPAQTIVDPGVVTFTGGVVLGNATNLPGLGFATPPNAYGTAGFGTGTPNLLTFTIDPSFTADEISFALLNGSTIPSTFTVNLYSGATLVGTQNYTMPANLSSGYALPDLFATNITKVTVLQDTNDPSVNGYDFFVDSVAFNESIQQELSPTPEPGSLLLLGTGLAGVAGRLWAKRRSQQ